MTMKPVKFISLILAIPVFLSGCGGSSSTGSEKVASEGVQKPAEQQKLEPVTLKVVKIAKMSDDEFQTFIVNPAAKEYPHITIEPFTAKWQDAIQAGETPDLMMNAGPLLTDVASAGLTMDMSALVKKFNMDLKVFDPNAIDTIRAISGGKEIWAIPVTSHTNGLYYNKDIFDKFGVGYPKDGMTWEDARELATKLTRSESGVQYRGMEPEQPWRNGPALGQTYVDPKTKKAVINTDKWKQIFSLFKTIYDIPGNNNIKYGVDQFTKDKNLAMLPQFDLYRRLEPFNMNWDVATYPVFKEAPGIGSLYDNIFINVTSSSKHQDDAMRVVEAVSTSENQLAMSKYGFAPAMDSPEIVKQFGVDQPALKGKHLEALFKIHGAKAPELTKYDPIVRAELNNAMARIVNEGADVNTALRQAEETANSKIQADAK